VRRSDFAGFMFMNDLFMNGSTALAAIPDSNNAREMGRAAESSNVPSPSIK
jgi:hypothetical protein